MDYCEDLARSCERLNFPPTLFPYIKYLRKFVIFLNCRTAEKNQATSQMNLG